MCSINPKCTWVTSHIHNNDGSVSPIRRQELTAGVPKAADYKLYSIDTFMLDAKPEVVSAMAREVDAAMEQARIHLAVDMEEAWKKRIEHYMEQDQMWGVWCEQELTGHKWCCVTTSNNADFVGLKAAAEMRATELRSYAAKFYPDAVYSVRPYDGQSSGQGRVTERYPADTIEHLRSDRDAWKQKASEEKARCSELNRRWDAWQKTNEPMQRANQMADKAAFAERCAREHAAEAHRFRESLADLRRYVGSNVCRTYDRLRAKEKAGQK